MTAMIVVAVAVLLAACSDDEPRASQPEITVPSTTSTTAASSTTSTSEPTPERVEATPPPDEPRPDIDVNVTYPSNFTEEQVEVVEAYRGYWHAYYLARDPCGPTAPGAPADCTTDPDHPLIADYASGSRLEAVRANLAVRSDTVSFLPSDGSYRHEVSDVAINSLGAIVTACSVDDAVVLAAATGAVVDEDVVTTRVRATLSRDGGRWFVTGDALVVLDEWNGDEGDQCLAGT